MTPKPQATREKDKLKVIKILKKKKKLCLKVCYQYWEKTTCGMEKIFSNHLYYKGYKPNYIKNPKTQ